MNIKHARYVFFLLSFGALLPRTHAQISITSISASDEYAQNFNTYAGTALSIPTGWTVTFSATSNFGGTNAGTTATGGAWAFGASSDFSLGALHTGGTGIITLGVSFTNNTGSTLSSLTLNWNYEQYRYPNASGFSLSGTGALAGNSSITASGFTGSNSGTSGVATQTPISITLSGLSISNGSSFGFQWATTDPSGNDNNIALDDFRLNATAIPEPSAYAELLGMMAVGWACVRKRIRSPRVS
jgi:hypothetical protein